MKLLSKNLKGSKTHEKTMLYFVWLICQKAITVRPRSASQNWNNGDSDQ